jgi:hypothetical protein
MSATTTEGTGPGAVERHIPRIYNQQIRAKDIVDLGDIVQEINPRRVDGGELKALMLNLSSEEMEIILRAADILNSLKKS